LAVRTKTLRAEAEACRSLASVTHFSPEQQSLIETAKQLDGQAAAQEAHLGLVTTAAGPQIPTAVEEAADLLRTITR
jgi:hypothetical protein